METKTFELHIQSLKDVYNDVITDILNIHWILFYKIKNNVYVINQSHLKSLKNAKIIYDKIKKELIKKKRLQILVLILK
jgi:myo-inositol-1-phosphate synthase